MPIASPIVVSFYGGDASYYAAAERLRQDCTALGLDHDIVELPDAVGQSWLQLCRRKPAFYVEMQKKHVRPILWLDVDSRLTKRPSFLDGLSSDVAGFLRGFRYLRDFDPVQVPRFFAPFALYFNCRPRVTAFLEIMVRLEQECSEEASDDFFLHEAWLRHEDQLSVTILPPDLVGHDWPPAADQEIYVGISGNVSRFKGQAKQHGVPLFEPDRRKAVLVNEADEAAKEGNVGDAEVLYRRVLAMGPDDAVAKKLARVQRRKR